MYILQVNTVILKVDHVNLSGLSCRSYMTNSCNLTKYHVQNTRFSLWIYIIHNVTLTLKQVRLIGHNVDSRKKLTSHHLDLTIFACKFNMMNC